MTQPLAPWVPNPADLEDGQMLQWNAATGRFEAVDAPAPGAGDSGSIRATDATNTALTSGDEPSFVHIGTNAFVEVLAPTDWTFVAAGCLWQYTGAAGKRFLFNMAVTLNAVFEAAAGSLFMAIDQNDVLFGASALTAFGESVVFQSFTLEETSASIVKTLTTSRLITPAENDVIQPVFAYTADFDIQIQRLSMSVIEI